MEFLVFCDINTHGLDSESRARIYEAEGTRAQELVSAGQLIRVWRVPGTTDNIGLWRADDATALHEAIASLPLFPWMTVEVRVLAQHPNDPDFK